MYATLYGVAWLLTFCCLKSLEIFGLFAVSFVGCIIAFSFLFHGLFVVNVESTCSFVCLDTRLLIQLIEGHYGDGLVAFVVVATSVSD